MNRGENPTNTNSTNLPAAGSQKNESIETEHNNQPTKVSGFESSPPNDEIDLNDFAGFNPNVPLALEAQYQLAQDEEKPEPPPVAERGVPRTVTMLILTGGAILLGLVVWQFVKPRSAVKPMAQSTPKETKEPLIKDEKPELLARLAYQDQQKLIAQKPKTDKQSPIEPDPKPTPKASPKPTPRRIVERPAPRQVAARPAPPPPAPRTIVRTVTAPAPPPKTIVRTITVPAPASVPTSKPIPTPTPTVEKVDPFERWNQLAQLGQTRGNVETEESLTAQHSPVPTSNDTSRPTSPLQPRAIPEFQVASNPVGQRGEGQEETTEQGNNRAEPSLSDPRPTTDERTSEILTVSIGNLQQQERQPASNDLSPGAIGILNRTPQSPTTGETVQVALGTTAPGTVSVPLLWDEGSDQQLYDRFAITLTDDVQATDGSVAFSKGTVIIAKANGVSKDNHMVQASAIAVVYADKWGQVKQEEIPPGAVLIAGEGGEPLVAMGHLDPGADIAKQDMLVALLSGVGRVGEAFAEPRVRSSSSINRGGFSRDTITVESRNPQIWSAVLNGFFSPLARRLERRSDRAVEELLSRPNIAMVPKGAKVSVTVNSFLNVSR